MAKKPVHVTIRKASSAPPSEAIRAGFRSITLYLPDALADRLNRHCRETDREVSTLVSELLEMHFAGLEQPKQVAEDDAVAALMKWVTAKFSRVAALRPAWLF